MQLAETAGRPWGGRPFVTVRQPPARMGRIRRRRDPLPVAVTVRTIGGESADNPANPRNWAELRNIHSCHSLHVTMVTTERGA
jgi:hypothetical protein